MEGTAKVSAVNAEGEEATAAAEDGTITVGVDAEEAPMLLNSIRG